MGDSHDDLEKKGLEVLEAIGWGNNQRLKDLDEELWKVASVANFGTIWSRPGLTLREREMICISVLVAVGATGVSAHFENAKALGISDDELREIIIQVVPYAGLPKAVQAMAILKNVKEGKPNHL